MKIKHVSFMGLLVVLVAILVTPGQVGAGSEGGQPPAGGVSGPEIWGVVVLDCNIRVATLRVKRINDCVVETEAVTSSNWTTCPANEKSPINMVLTGVDLTSVGITGTPIITKVKNFELKNNIASFDAQIRSTP